MLHVGVFCKSLPSQVILTGSKNLEIIAPHAANTTRGWSQQYGGEVTDGPTFLQIRSVGYLMEKANRTVGISRERERVLLKCRVLKLYEILSLEQTRRTRREEENKQRNQMEISQFFRFFISYVKTRDSE